MELQDLVPVYSASDPVKAHLVKNLLEEEGIRAFIEGENQDALPGLISFEVKVLVEADRADDARKLIEPHEEKAIEDQLAEIEEPEEETAATPAP